MMFKQIQVFLPFLSRGRGHSAHYFYKEIRPQADASRLVSRLRVKINDEKRLLSRPSGPEGRLLCLRQAVTALLKYERIELNYNRAHESQGYAERLISEAIRHGDCHIATMEMADYWLLEKQLIHKLFKVLVPRFESSTRSYTKFFSAPRPYYASGFYTPPKDSYIDVKFGANMRYPKAVLELRGNPFPPLLTPQVSNPRSLHNVLLHAAREEKRREKVAHSLREDGLLRLSPRVQNILEKSKAIADVKGVSGEDQSI